MAKNEKEKWTEVEKNNSREHIYYEIDMFLKTYYYLVSVKGVIVENKDFIFNHKEINNFFNFTIIESLGIHFRVLYEFFTQYVEIKGRKIKKPFNDDLDLKNYFSELNYDKFTKETISIANNYNINIDYEHKLLAHLTEKRMKKDIPIQHYIDKYNFIVEYVNKFNELNNIEVKLLSNNLNIINNLSDINIVNNLNILNKDFIEVSNHNKDYYALQKNYYDYNP